MNKKIFQIIFTFLIIFIISCQNKTNSVTIGSKFFTEQKVIAEIISIYLENKADVKVKRKIPLGDTFEIFSALRSGEIDIYPEYTGTGLTLIYDNKKGNSTEILNYLRDKYKSNFELNWLSPFGFSNTYIFLTSKDKANEFKIKSISDLKDKNLVIGVEPEFFKREQDGFKNISEVYGIKWKNIRILSKTALYSALERESVDVIVGYSTDSEIEEFSLFMIKDDKSFFPPYDLVPLVRQEVLNKYPKIESALNDLSMIINETTMQKLNYEVDFLNRSPYEVAKEFLLRKNLISQGQRITKPSVKIAISKEKNSIVEFSNFLKTILSKPESPYNVTFVEKSNVSKSLSIGEVEMALLNSSSYFSVTDKDIAKRRNDVGAIVEFYPEVFHILVNTNKNINLINDLVGKSVNIGLQGSSTSLAARMLFDAYNIPSNNINKKGFDNNKALTELKSGSIDAIFVMAPLGNKFIKEAISNKDIKLLSIEDWVGKNKFYKYLFLKPFTIESNIYNTESEIKTFNTTVTLAVRTMEESKLESNLGKPMGAVFQNVDKNVVDYILSQIFDNKDAIETFNKGQIANLNVETVKLPEIYLPMPHSALKYYEKADLINETRAQQLASYNENKESNFFNLDMEDIASIILNLFVAFVMVIAIYELRKRRKK